MAAVFARSRLRRTVLAAILLLGVGVGLRELWLLAADLRTFDIYRKDFEQEYLLSRALVEGRPLYANRVALTDAFGMPDGATPSLLTTIPIYYPPAVAILFVPFAFVPYPAVPAIWLAIEIILLGLTIFLLIRAQGARASPWLIVALTISAIATSPVRTEMSGGQLMILLLTLIAAAQLAIVSGRPSLGGALIGLAVMIKVIPLPLLVLFAIRREWRLLRAGVLTIVVGYAITTAVVGPATLIDYVVRVVPSAEYGNWGNISFSGIATRVFEGVGSPDRPGSAILPLVYAPTIGTIVSRVVSIAILAGALVWAATSKRLDVAIGVIACVSILVSPIAHPHYLVWVLLPAAPMIAWTIRRRVVGRWTVLFAASVALLSIPQNWWLNAAHALAGESVIESSGWVVLPFGPGLVTLAPMLALITLCWAVVATQARLVQSTRREATTKSLPESEHLLRLA